MPTEADSNPYAVHSPIQGRLQPSPADPVHQLVGITRTGLEPSESLTVERKLRSYSGSHWILPITLFVVFFFVVATIPVNPLIRACLWGMVLAIPVLAWGAIYSSIRMIAPGLSRLSGCAEIPLTIELDGGGFRLLAPGVDQYGTWAMVHGHVVQGQSWILLLSSAIHRSGLIVACNESTTMLEGVDRFALQCRRTPNNQRVSNELIDEREPKGVVLETPILQQTTRVFSRDLIDEQPEDWLWLRRYFIASALLRMDLVLLAGTALTSVVESPWMGVLVLIPLTLATLFKLRRGLRILFRKNAVISNLEFKVYEEGYEKRTNAYHTRVLWSVLRDVNIERDRLFARYVGSEHLQPIFAKQWFHQESDWQVVCQLAQGRIGQSGAPTTSDQG